MLHWNLRSLIAERGTFAASAAGIALALLLALYLDAVFRGEALQIVTFIERTRADVWVLQRGVSNLHMASTRLTENEVAAVAAVPGVAGVSRVIYHAAAYGVPGAERVAYIVGVPSGDEGMRVLVGTAVMPEPGTAIVPEPMALRAGLAMGDPIRIRNRTFRIGGFSHGTFSMANPLIYLTEDDARTLFEIGDGANLLLVSAARGVQPSQLARSIEDASEYVSALTQAELVDNDYRLALDMGGALVGILGVIGAAVAGLIVAFSAYAFAARHARELAVAKALGARPAQLMVSVLAQASLVGLSGGLLAVPAMLGLDAALSVWVPEVAVEPSPSALGMAAVASVLVAALAAAVPAALIQRTDPALAFQA